MTETPFRIDVPESVLDDLADRLARTRWPDQVAEAGWDYGTDLDYLRELCDCWQHTFDWRAAEARLNAHEQVLVDVDGLRVHVQRQRSADPDAPVLLLLHGWPDSVFRFSKVLPLLTEFDVVVPSLPGYGFSDRPRERGFSSWRMAETIADVMRQLDLPSYVVHGGDIGSGVGEALARLAPESVVALHLTDIPLPAIFTVDPAILSEAERAYLEAGRKWQSTEGAYALLQSTRPQSAAVGLNDSPAGLAAWFERAGTEPKSDRLQVPTGVTIFPHDLVLAPREFGERFFDVRRWTEMPRGGHFAALEEPELFADDIRAFVHGLRKISEAFDF